MLSANLLERRLQVAAIALLTGLIVEVLCLLGKGPIAFLLFSGVYAALFAAGILLYRLQRSGYLGSLVGHNSLAGGVAHEWRSRYQKLTSWPREDRWLYLQIAGVGLVVCHATAAARHEPLDARNSIFHYFH